MADLSKVKVLGGTTMTTQTSNSDPFINSSVNNNVETDKCVITLLGASDLTIDSPKWSLLDIINEGRWQDPGYTYTRKDKYAVKKFYGYVTDSTATISDIKINRNNT